MALSRNVKIILIVAFVAVIAIGTPLVAITLLNASTGTNHGVSFKLLDNAGVMIEHNGVRIYVDPYNLPSTYTQYPADAILVTHPHGDHYDPTSINRILDTDTVCVFPENMTDAIILYSGTGVTPGDSVQVGHISITAFYMYTFDLGGGTATHPREAEWCSYIIDINGFTIFHAGDSKDIPEYSQLTSIEVACLPLGPGCQTMVDDEVVDAIEEIEPQYFVPIHFFDETAKANFIANYGSQVNSAGAQIVDLDYFHATAHIF
jgi:L-ascorbate metabolism protein UlaG (beta-lactamase superfamily)